MTYGCWPRPHPQIYQSSSRGRAFFSGVIKMKHYSCIQPIDIVEPVNPGFMGIELVCLRDRGHVVQVGVDLI
jgi:hypothetical protein